MIHADSTSWDDKREVGIQPILRIRGVLTDEAARLGAETITVSHFRISGSQAGTWRELDIDVASQRLINRPRHGPVSDLLDDPEMLSTFAEREVLRREAGTQPVSQPVAVDGGAPLDDVAEPPFHLMNDPGSQPGLDLMSQVQQATLATLPVNVDDEGDKKSLVEKIVDLFVKEPAADESAAIQTELAAPQSEALNSLADDSVLATSQSMAEDEAWQVERPDDVADFPFYLQTDQSSNKTRDVTSRAQPSGMFSDQVSQTETSEEQTQKPPSR